MGGERGSMGVGSRLGREISLGIVELEVGGAAVELALWLVVMVAAASLASVRALPWPYLPDWGLGLTSFSTSSGSGNGQRAANKQQQCSGTTTTTHDHQHSPL